MAHMAILEDELEDVPEVPVYLPEEWLQGDMDSLNLWLDDQSTLEGRTPGIPFKSALSQYNSVQTRWLVKVWPKISSYGDVLVNGHHGWYFLGVSLRRAALVQLLTEALRSLAE